LGKSGRSEARGQKASSKRGREGNLCHWPGVGRQDRAVCAKEKLKGSIDKKVVREKEEVKKDRGGFQRGKERSLDAAHSEKRGARIREEGNIEV